MMDFGGRSKRKYILDTKGWLLISTLFLIGSSCFLVYFQQKKNTTAARLTRDKKDSLASRLSEQLQAKNMDDNLRYLSRYPHVAGSARNNELGREIARRWKKYGFDKVEMPRYDILLSLPDDKHPSSVSLVSREGHVKTTYPIKEKVLVPSEDVPGLMPTFLSFTGNGTAVGDVIYANFGTDGDFNELTKMGISVKECIVLVRQGRIFRGNKVRNAEKYGARGIIIYTDPDQFAPDGANQTYPNTWWLPKTGLQRGAASLETFPGDVLTPGYPSVDGIYRTQLKNVKHSKIPAHEISYDDALDIFRRLKGPLAPANWKGGLTVTYRIGPGFVDHATQVKINVRNIMVEKPIYNVIGTIKGREEPDRYVLLGNHRDAWAFGASDPSSGTSVMMEISRGLGELLKNGWRPRRTIMVCSWDAEEQFVSGSSEWVEDNAAILATRAVAYINLDIGVGGNFTLNIDGSPLIQDVLISTAKEVIDPTSNEANKSSMYDVMIKRDVTKNINNQPVCKNLAFGSDYVSFYHFLGIVSGDVSYIFGGSHGIRRAYPLYHSIHDNYYWMKTFIDPSFNIHLAVGQYVSRLLLKLADSEVLPLNPTKFAAILKLQVKILSKNPSLKKHDIDLHILSKAVDLFQKYSVLFEKTRSKLSLGTSVVRILNDQIMNLERAFINTFEKTEHVLFRNVIYGPDWENIYKGHYFPRIYDAIRYALKGEGNWENVKKEISVVLYSIQSAVKMLEPVV